MLSLMLTYHDRLYLATELGTLGLVLLLSWVVTRLEHPHSQP
jgi:hypothetical protein